MESLASLKVQACHPPDTKILVLGGAGRWDWCLLVPSSRLLIAMQRLEREQAGEKLGVAAELHLL